ncbi:hypothetical protein SprV_0100368400 [Sparganum proliferum]
MEVVELPGMAYVDAPDLRSVKEFRQDNGLVHPEFGVQLRAVTIPHRGLQLIGGLAGFGEATSSFIVYVCVARECAYSPRPPTNTSPTTIHLFTYPLCFVTGCVSWVRCGYLAYECTWERFLKTIAMLFVLLTIYDAAN